MAWEPKSLEELYNPKGLDNLAATKPVKVTGNQVSFHCAIGNHTGCTSCLCICHKPMCGKVINDVTCTKNLGHEGYCMGTPEAPVNSTVKV